MERERARETPDPAAGVLPPDQVRSTLQQVALFQGLGGDDLEEILRISEPVLVEASELVFEEGERGDHFYIIVRGEIELSKVSGTGSKKLAVLREGQAFGEMALLNQTPRSASATAVEDTYMLSVSRDAFGEILGGETLAVRLLRNLSKALWATSVRLAARQAKHVRSDTPHEALADFNRLLRARLLPRVTPRVSGFDVTASTLAPRQGSGASAWDWFLLTDGRPVFVVMKAVRADIFSAQRLAGSRTLLRSFADEDRTTLGGLLTKVSRSLRAGWIEGLSGAIACAGVALTERGCEYAVAGDLAGVLVRAVGTGEDLCRAQPALGDLPDYTFRSATVELGARDKVILLSERPRNPVRLVTSVLTGGYTSDSRRALMGLFDRLGTAAAAGGAASDLTGAVITSTRSP